MSNKTAAADDLTVIIERLREALRRRFGAAVDIDNIDIATLGGSNRTVLFDLNDGGWRRRMVLRQETYTMSYSPFLSPEQQWPLLQVAFKHGLPVPEPIFKLEPQDQLGRGYVVGFVAGETLPKRHERVQNQPNSSSGAPICAHSQSSKALRPECGSTIILPVRKSPCRNTRAGASGRRSASQRNAYSNTGCGSP